jgi:hypothetical protein
MEHGNWQLLKYQSLFSGMLPSDKCLLFLSAKKSEGSTAIMYADLKINSGRLMLMEEMEPLATDLTDHQQWSVL